MHNNLLQNQASYFCLVCFVSFDLIFFPLLNKKKNSIDLILIFLKKNFLSFQEKVFNTASDAEEEVQ